MDDIVRRIVAEAEEQIKAADGADAATVALRLDVMRRIVAAGLVTDCMRVNASLPEISAAIANGLQLKSNDDKARGRARKAGTRSRVARHRAMKTPNARRIATAIVESSEARSMRLKRSADRAGLFAHAGLYDHFVRDCAFSTVSRSQRRDMDLLMMALLERFGLTRTGDYASFRRQRRRLVNLRPRLFLRVPHKEKEKPKR